MISLDPLEFLTWWWEFMNNFLAYFLLFRNGDSRYLQPCHSSALLLKQPHKFLHVFFAQFFRCHHCSFIFTISKEHNGSLGGLAPLPSVIYAIRQVKTKNKFLSSRILCFYCFNFVKIVNSIRQCSWLSLIPFTISKSLSCVDQQPSFLKYPQTWQLASKNILLISTFELVSSIEWSSHVRSS